MKFILLGLSLIFAGSSSFADRPIPPDQLASYVQAAEIGISGMNLYCRDQNNDVVTDLIYNYLTEVDFSNIKSGTISNSGSQPVLTFILPLRVGQELIQVTSSADYKSVLELDISNQTLQDVNNGTLLKPAISKAMVNISSTICVQGGRRRGF